ncbi:MAG: hypothetical protein EON54_17145 [Alcaligenaceae bacterium]|nr:MAG: hypothetical protein EON54_17145 [Alcaligenaceae bacterium]
MKISIVLTLSVWVLVAACTKQEVAESPKFDAKTVAAEADKGNLVPLKDLNAACSAEVEKTGKRAAACETQDEVGALRKPLKLTF